MLALANLLGDPFYSLLLAIVCLTDRCNSKCVTCDNWRYGQTFLSMDRAQALAVDFDRLRTRAILLSGGEPLLHPQWAQIARTLLGHGRRLSLLTANRPPSRHTPGPPGRLPDVCVFDASKAAGAAGQCAMILANHKDSKPQ